MRTVPFSPATPQAIPAMALDNSAAGLPSPPHVYPPLWAKVERMIAAEATTDEPEKVRRATKILQEVMRVVPGAELLLRHLYETRESGTLFESTRAEKGTVLYVDVAGFTAKVEEGTKQRGDAGKVRAAINTTFSSFDEAVHAHGGEVVKLGGDSMTIVLRGKNSLQQARMVADELLKIAAQTQRVQIKVGGAHGEVHFSILSDDTDPGNTRQRNLFIAGPAYKNALLAESKTEHGKKYIMEEAQAREEAGDDATVYNLDKEVERLVAGYKATTPQEAHAALSEAIGTILTFTPRGTSDRLLAGMTGKGKEVSPTTQHTTVFIAIPEGDLFYADYQRRLRAFYRRVVQEAAREGGEVNKTDGTKIILSFTEGSGHMGDSEERAYRCASSLMEKEGAAMGLRIGIASGSTISGRMGAIKEGIPTGTYEYTYLGASINLAARLMSAAKTGGMLISESVQAACSNVIRKIVPARKQLKGIGEDVACFEVEGLRKNYGMELRELYATDHDLQERQVDVERAGIIITGALEKKRYRHIAITGDMGTGKTALAGAIVHRVQQQSGPSQAKIHAVKNRSHQAPLAVCGDIIRIFLECDPQKSPDEQCREMAARLEELEVQEPERSALLSVTGAIETAHPLSTIQSAMVLLARKSAERIPRLLLIEDIHWCDEDSLLVLDFMNRNLEDADVPFVLVTTRRSVHGAQEATKLSTLPLVHRESVAALIDDLLHAGRGREAEAQGDEKGLEVPEGLVNIVLKTSEGNPLAIREIVSLLVRDGYLRRGSTDLQKPLPTELTGRTAMTELMWSNISNLIKRRVLDENSRHILILLAVLGSPAPRFFMEALYEGNAASFDQDLARLEAQGLIAIAPDEVRFKSALMGEAIHQGVLAEDVKSTLQRAMDIFEDKNGGETTTDGMRRKIQVYRATHALQYEDALFRYGVTAEDDDRIFEHGTKIVAMAMDNPSLRRRAITYGEKTLEVARRTRNAREVRSCLTNLGTLKTYIAGHDNIKEGIASFDEALGILCDASLESEDAYLFERLGILRVKTIAVIMKKERDPLPFVSLAEEQQHVLDDLEKLEKKEDPRYMSHFFNFQNCRLTAQLYRGLEEKGQDRKKAKATFRGVQKECKELLKSPPLQAHPRFNLLFLYLHARALQEQYKMVPANKLKSGVRKLLHHKMVTSLSKAVTLHKALPDAITEPSDLQLIMNVYTSYAQAHAERARNHRWLSSGIKKDQAHARQYYEEALQLVRDSGNVFYECNILEVLANDAELNKDGEECIHWASLGYRRAKEHHILRELAFACTNICLGYLYLNQPEKGQRYYQELVGLVDQLPEPYHGEIQVAMPTILAPYASH